MATPQQGNKPPYKVKKTSWINDRFNYKRTGEHPKHYIAKYVIRWSFWAAMIVTGIVVVNYWLFRDCENKVPDITGDLRVIWEIVTPLITLVLGYEFGRIEKE